MRAAPTRSLRSREPDRRRGPGGPTVTPEPDLLERELRVAQRIQRTLVQLAGVKAQGWEITSEYRPARSIGGDFFDVFPILDPARPRQLGVVIADYKTSELESDDEMGEKAEENARKSLQLSVYALAQRELTGRAPERVELRYVLSGAVGVSTRSEEQLERTRDRILAIAGSIRAGDFRARPSPRNCSICACRPICRESAV